MERIRRFSDIPIQIGFGISTPDQVKTVIGHGANGAIIGSEVVRKVNDNNQAALITYVQSLIEARGRPLAATLSVINLLWIHIMVKHSLFSGRTQKRAQSALLPLWQTLQQSCNNIILLTAF